MIDFSKYGINYNPKTDYNIVTNDLIAIGNIDRNIIDTKVIEDNGNTLLIKGEYVISNKSAVVGGEIIKVISSEKIDKNTKITVVRGLSGTLQQSWAGYNFRTVVLLDESNTDIDLTDWSFEDTIGGVTNNLFPCELGSGNVTMKSDLALWSSMSLSQKYRIRNRKTVVYIFKGVGDKRILKFTTIVTKLGVNTRGKSDPNRIRLDIKTKLATWYDKDLAVNRQLKGTNPKEFFKLIFGLNDDEVYYANGVNDNSFLKINNLHTKEYKKVSEILKAYCSNGVRFCFDPFERVKIFSDFKVANIQSQKTIYEDLTDSTLTEDEAMIYNTISTQAVQRQTMYNFSDMQNKYVMYAKKLGNVVSSDKFIKAETNGDFSVNTIEIINSDVHSSCQIGDVVCFKRTVEPKYEYFAKVLDIQPNNKVFITPILYDKDFKLFSYGKNTYMYNILNRQVCQMDLYYVRQELPIIFKYTRNKGGEEKDSSLMYPILPRVNGETLYPVETNITFGCASNLKVGSYTGIVEEVDKLYGVWDSNKLLYNREIDQFNNTTYPPIFALTNKVNERITSANTPIINYTNFDNSDFLLEVNNPTDTSNDAILKMYNTKTVNKDIDMYVDQEISRLGNRIIQVSDISAYKIGDVLIVNKADDLTPQEETEYDEVLSNIRWVVTGKESQTNNGTTKHYIFVDSNFAKRQSSGKVYQFTRFPNWSIVYLQELYFRGNPVIEFKQDVTGIAKGTNYDGDRSTDIYGEKKYEFDSKQLDKENMKMMMGYILDHFQAVNLPSTKFNAPISTYNGIDIELLDVVTVIDPTHTKIDESSKWVVVSVINKIKTNVVQLKLLNINTTDTKPFKLDVKDVLEYKPVEIPTYDHNGNEGSGGGDNDGTGGDGVDKSIGVFHMSEVDPQIFRAKVERFEGNYIYFKDLAGSEWETYAGKLFPESEFGVSIDGETFLVHSDMNYRAFIRKRDVYNTGEQILITPESDVKFLIMTSFTDIDGQFYSRRCMIGDGDTYFQFHPVTGAKFVGDFVIGENNQNAGNDLWESLQKNRTFHQNTPPVSDNSYTLRIGDIWYDLDDENHVYRYNGDVWRSCRDNSIISTQSSSFVQDEPPQATAGRPINNGDTWYDSNDGYKPYVYKDGKWINVTDGNLQQAIEDARQQAEGALNLLSELASDGKLTPNEKQQTKKEWDIIVGEYPQNVSKATAYGVSTTNYTDKYNILKTYIEPLVANLSTTSDVVGDTFRANFKNYYEAEISLTGNIYDKVKESAVTDSKSYADSIDSKLTGYMSDGVLTPQEKGDLRYEIMTIESRATSLKSRASVFGVSTTKLTEYVTVLTNWKNGVLSQSGIYNNLTQVNVLRVDFRNYYTEEEKVYDGIDKKAKELADKAQSDANGALGQLTDIASDNKLTPSEKQQTKKEWDIIVGEYPKIVEELTKFGVSKTDYTNSYNTLSTYITPLLSNINTTSDINGEIFRTNFKNYYYNKQVALNSLNDAIKNSAIDSSKDYSDKVTDALGKDLENQIDGKINTYNQEEDPSLTWSAIDKNKHIGDLWYKQSEKLTRRWEGTIWKTLDAKDTVAQELANSKRTVFTEEPTTPYQSGDLWLAKKMSVIRVSRNENNQSTYVDFSKLLSKEDSDLMVCVNKKDAGEFSYSDWKIATNYTGDDLAEKALVDSDRAKEEANKVNKKVDYVVSDGVLTPAEKSDLLVSYKDIVNEYPLLTNRADVFRVDKGNIVTKYSDLVNYVLPVLNEVGNSEIDSATFRNYFNTYYVERNNIYDRIEKKAKELADNAQSDATTALGNSKIFYQTSPPTNGMKVNDLWYDTDDQNHPYIYNGSTWISARDKIFETEGGNKVYFQSTQPPTSGTGVKDGDMWFHTGANNKMYILINKVWTLADDALDKVNTGRIVLNGNTTINGDFTVRGASVELTGATKVNGILEVFSNDKGIISYNGTSEANSTKRIIIKGGIIQFQEKV